ncbi:MAG: hypothetical protein PF689_11320, partial [Deltaproteobacteria bacterium]|nr:hypothetical protein [Deltaproteobacteria bacterium]
ASAVRSGGRKINLQIRNSLLNIDKNYLSGMIIYSNMIKEQKLVRELITNRDPAYQDKSIC